MPATEKQISDLNDELTALAGTIETDSNSLAQTIAAIEEANEEIETRKAQMMGDIFNERFEINLKLKYTNDDQRRVRLIELQNADANFQTFVSVRSTLAATSAAQKAAIEKNRNLHKTKLLVLQYFANLP